MKKIVILFTTIYMVMVVSGCKSTKIDTEGSRVDKPIVILKLDDLRDTTFDKFNNVADFILENNLKASFGINGKYLLNKHKNHPLITNTKYWANTGSIEIWHHGWDHSKDGDRSWYEYKQRDKDERDEYSDITSNYDRQYRDFKNTMDIVEELCGVTMRTFGSPYNQNDETFVEVINQFPDMKVVFFPRTPISKQMELSIKTSSGRLNIEDGTGNADYDYFLTNYNSYDHSMEYMVLQAHPGNFSNQAMDSFKQICNYLVENGHTFMTPHEYFIHKTGGIMPELEDIPLPPPADELTLEDINLLQNGEFNSDKDWSLYLGNDSSGELQINNQEAHVLINNPGTNPWDIQLKQGDIRLDQGTKYRVVFNARTISGSRTIESNVIDDKNTKLAYSNKETLL